MEAKFSKFLLLFISIPLAACASVSVIPLDYHGQPKNEAPGVRYYMPKPYLLVTQLNPPTDGKGKNNPGGGGSTATATCNGNTATATCDGGKSAQNAGPPAGDGNTESQSDGSTKGASNSPSPSSDLSYQLGSTTYLLKLIYLPDMSKTMAINVVPGIFGTSSAQPVLQDGWMLTSLQASSDNTKALDDLTSFATALLGAGGKAATGGGAAAAGSKAAHGPPEPPPPTRVLPAGLYEFRYDEYGHLIGLCAVTTFHDTPPYALNTGLIPSDLDGVGATGQYCPSIAALRGGRLIRAKG